MKHSIHTQRHEVPVGQMYRPVARQQMLRLHQQLLSPFQAPVNQTDIPECVRVLRVRVTGSVLCDPTEQQLCVFSLTGQLDWCCSWVSHRNKPCSYFKTREKIGDYILLQQMKPIYWQFVALWLFNSHYSNSHYEWKPFYLPFFLFK